MVTAPIIIIKHGVIKTETTFTTSNRRFTVNLINHLSDTKTNIALLMKE